MPTPESTGGIPMTRRGTPSPPNGADQFRMYIDEMDDQLKMVGSDGIPRQVRPSGNMSDQNSDMVDITDGSGRFATIGYSQRGSVTQSTSKTSTVTLDGFATIDLTTASTSIAQGVPTSFTLNSDMIRSMDQITVTHHVGGTVGAYAVNGRAVSDGVGQITMTKITSGSEGAALQLIVSISGRPA